MQFVLVTTCFKDRFCATFAFAYCSHLSNKPKIIFIEDLSVYYSIGGGACKWGDRLGWWKHWKYRKQSCILIKACLLEFYKLWNHIFNCGCTDKIMYLLVVSRKINHDCSIRVSDCSIRVSWSLLQSIGPKMVGLSPPLIHYIKSVFIIIKLTWV